MWEDSNRRDEPRPNYLDRHARGRFVLTATTLQKRFLCLCVLSIPSSSASPTLPTIWLLERWVVLLVNFVSSSPVAAHTMAFFLSISCSPASLFCAHRFNCLQHALPYENFARRFICMQHLVRCLVNLLFFSCFFSLYTQIHLHGRWTIHRYMFILDCWCSCLDKYFKSVNFDC